ncbi:unnamed protein product [Paramecium pentaurelia]|uniref:Uncharacterized protein n=1 Tax=Paramecium pentaurelia TaxID=43138 RepID=A0A8S1XZA9_9CILI|nr:unnamed protein product [Paramecium pentaurelia]
MDFLNILNPYIVEWNFQFEFRLPRQLAKVLFLQQYFTCSTKWIEVYKKKVHIFAESILWDIILILVQYRREYFFGESVNISVPKLKLHQKQDRLAIKNQNYSILLYQVNQILREYDHRQEKKTQNLKIEYQHGFKSLLQTGQKEIDSTWPQVLNPQDLLILTRSIKLSQPKSIFRRQSTTTSIHLQQILIESVPQTNESN